MSVAYRVHLPLPAYDWAAEGDSITIGAFSGEGQVGYPDILIGQGTPRLTLTNLAHAGNGIPHVIGRAATVDALTSVPRVLSVLIGCNDLSNMLNTEAQFLSDVAGYFDGRSSDFKKIACTILPSTRAVDGGDPPSFNTRRNSVNDVIRTWVGVHVDAVCDFAANPTIGPDAAASDGDKYGDGIHPSHATQLVMATVMLATLNSLGFGL